MTNTVIQEWTDEKGWIHRIEIPLTTFLIEHNLEPVVRCKDCKYMTEHYDTDGNAPYWTCSEWDAGTDYDGYCHYGERRENDKSIRA